MTPSWSVPFTLGRAGFSFDGFADFTGNHGDCAAQVLTHQRLKLDLSRFWHKPGALEVGVEWEYWHNKYGVGGVKNSVIQPLLVWAF